MLSREVVLSDDILSRTPPPAAARVEYGEDPHQFGDVRLPKNKPLAAIVMNIHGGYWRNKYDLAHAGHLCAALSENGLLTWNVEYRRVGDPGGGWPGSISDIQAAYQFVPQLAKRFQFKADRVIVMGHSAGGQLALCLAAREPALKTVVSLAGVLDLQRAWELHLSNDAVVGFLGGTPKQNSANYAAADPMQLHIAAAEQVIVHGTKDDVVPPDFSRKYYEAKSRRGEHVKLLEIENADHFDLIDPRSAAWGKVEEAVLSLAGTP